MPLSVAPLRWQVKRVHSQVTTNFRRVRRSAKGDCYFRNVCPSIRTEQLGSHRTDFHQIRCLSIFRKSVEEIWISSKSKKNIWYFRWRPILHLWSQLAESFSQWETFRRNVIEKIKTHILCSVILFPKIVLFMRYCGKCGTARQATDGNIVWRMRLACWKI